MYTIEDLMIPTKEEAREMTKPHANVNGEVRMVRPDSYDLKQAVAKGLCSPSGFGDKYLYMQALYRKALEQYFMDAMTLKEFDEHIGSHELNFQPVSSERYLFYQKYSTMPLDFIYLRSNLPIERLDSEDLKIIENLIHSGRSDVTDELAAMVVRTYPVVLKGCEDFDDNILVGFDATDAKDAPNLSVAFEISFQSEYAPIEKEKMSYIEETLIPIMAKALSEQLSFTVVVFFEP